MPSVSTSPPTSATATTTTTSPSSSSLPRPSAHVVLFLIDGLGDVPCRAFLGSKNSDDNGNGNDDNKNGKRNRNKNEHALTPLQAAAPLDALDAVASRGLLGLLDPVEPGKACGSDTAHLSLLGYDPRM